LGVRHHPLQVAERVDGDVGALERLQASDEDDERIVRESEPSLGRGTVAGTEPLEIDTRRRDEDVRWLRVVQVDQLVAFGLGRRDDAVGAGDHAVLAALAEDGLGRIAGARDVFHSRQRVEGNDMRDVPRLAQEGSRNPGEPVMRMDHVVRTVLHHAVRETPDQPWQQLLMDGSRRPG
jgi:hypothetical protein